MQLAATSMPAEYLCTQTVNSCINAVTGGRNALEDPWEEARGDMYTRSVSPEQAPDKPTYLDLEFEGGNPVAIDGQKLSPASLLTQLNKVQVPVQPVVRRWF